MRKVFFRADGSSEIGLGHLYRCLALAEMINESFYPVFCIRQAPDTFFFELVHRRIEYYTITSHAELVSLISPMDIVVWDHYDLDSHTISSLKNRGGRLVYVDDMLRGHPDFHLIINHAPGVQPDEYREVVGANTQFALGLDYTILRSEFLRAAMSAGSRKKSKLLICFGGSDPQNWTVRAIQAALEVPLLANIEVVIGASYGNHSAIRAIAKSHASIELFRNLTACEMVERMQANDYAVVSSSGILFEALALQMICVSLAYVDNQRRIFDGFRDLRLISPVENTFGLREGILKAIEGREAFEARMPVIDGLSGRRIQERIKCLVA